MASHHDLTGKVALITGAGRGIGLATAQRLAARGASVALVDLGYRRVEEAAAEIGAHRAVGLVADVTDRAALEEAVGAVMERFGGLDVVVANAGIASRAATFRAMAPEAFERVVEVDLLGVCRTVAVALPHVVTRRGHVVVVASLYAFANGFGATPYAISKAGVESFGRALRVEVAQHGVGVTIAYFGWIDTELVHRTIDADPMSRRMLAHLPAPLRTRLPASAAADAIVDGIERRRPRVMRPRRFAVMSALRGVLNPLLDEQMLRDAETQAIAREFDRRAGEEQPLSV